MYSEDYVQLMQKSYEFCENFTYLDSYTEVV